MKKYSDGHAMSGLFVFGLLGAFAVLSTLLVLLGAQAYRGVVDGANANSQERLLLSYPLNKVRMNDCADQIRVETVGGIDMLVISQDYDGDIYETLIYGYDGQLYEMFCSADDELLPEDGEPIAEAAYFRPALKDGVFSFDVGTPEGANLSAQVRLRSQPTAGEVVT